MTGTINRTPCPQCTEVGGLYIDTDFVSQPLGSFSLAGSKMKTSAQLMPILKCANCTMKLVGKFDGLHHADFSMHKPKEDS